MATPKGNKYATGGKGGQPTKDKPEYCEKVIKWGKEGKSRTWIAATLDTSRETLDNWAKANPEFFDALSRAKAHEQRWWEDAGQSGMTSDKFNSAGRGTMPAGCRPGGIGAYVRARTMTFSASMFAASCVAFCACAREMPRYEHIFVIIAENKDFDQIIGRPEAPRLNQLAKDYGLAAQFYAEVHPSEGNYVAMLGGDWK